MKIYDGTEIEFRVDGKEIILIRDVQIKDKRAMVEFYFVEGIADFIEELRNKRFTLSVGCKKDQLRLYNCEVTKTEFHWNDDIKMSSRSQTVKVRFIGVKAKKEARHLVAMTEQNGHNAFELHPELFE